MGLIIRMFSLNYTFIQGGVSIIMGKNGATKRIIQDTFMLATCVN